MTPADTAIRERRRRDQETACAELRRSATAQGAVSRLAIWALSALFISLVVGCEGIDRSHDARVGDIQPPPVDADSPGEGSRVTLANYPDLVESMLAIRIEFDSIRSKYVQQLLDLERAYLNSGDSVKANWARRQRERAERLDLEPYPYLTAAPPEHQENVAPEQVIAEADDLFNQAKALLDHVRGLPLKGMLDRSKDKARDALGKFRQLLRDYPTSDKVDDAAFYCGEIFKEYLREDDPDDELAIRYYKWSVALDPKTPHAARFQCAVVYDFRRHDRVRALELYHQVLETEENENDSNMRFSATRIEQLTDDDRSHLAPQVPRAVVSTPEERSEPTTP